MRPSKIALALIALAWALVSCPRDQREEPREEDSRVAIARITTELHAFDVEGQPMKLDTNLEGIVRTALGKARSIRPPGAEGEATGGARLKLRAMVSPDGVSGELHAVVSARLDHTGSIPLNADIDAVRPGAPDGGQLDSKVYAEHLEKAVGEAVAAIDEQVALLRGGNNTLVKALGHREPSVKIAAARTLGERRAKEAVDPLCKILREDTSAVGEAAVGALAAIGDAKAVPCLIGWAGSDDRRLVIVLDPIATLGGQEARAFLEMIASGHENPGIRRVAERSLGRVRDGSER